VSCRRPVQKIAFLYRCALDAGLTRQQAGALTHAMFIRPLPDEFAEIRSLFPLVVASTGLDPDRDGWLHAKRPRRELEVVA
jgi:hypothetical protein